MVTETESSDNPVSVIFRFIFDSNVVGAARREARPWPPRGPDKKSETALTGLEMSDVSFVRLSRMAVLLIEVKLTSDV